MYKVNGLTNYQRIHGQGLVNAQTLPQNASADGNEGPLKLSGTMGAVEVVVRASTALTIADTKTLTVKLQHRDGADAFADLGTVVSLTATGGSGAIAADTELGRFALPSTVKADVKAVITTTDAAAAGKIDVIPIYLPR